MKTLEYVKEHIDDVEKDTFLDRRFTKRFLDFIPVSDWEDFGFSPNEELDVDNFQLEGLTKEWTEKNVIAQLKSDTEFALEKALNHRGISASLMYNVLKSWCIVLENGLEHTEYGWYGDKLIRKIDEKYNFGLVTEDTFDDEFYEEW